MGAVGRVPSLCCLDSADTDKEVLRVFGGLSGRVLK